MAHSLNYKSNDIFPRKKEKIFSLNHMTFPVCSFAQADFFYFTSVFSRRNENPGVLIMTQGEVHQTGRLSSRMTNGC